LHTHSEQWQRSQSVGAPSMGTKWSSWMYVPNDDYFV